MIIIRKFSVRVNLTYYKGVDDLSPDKSYPVLAIDDSGDDTLVMIASDIGRCMWLDLSEEEAYICNIDE